VAAVAGDLGPAGVAVDGHRAPGAQRPGDLEREQTHGPGPDDGNVDPGFQVLAHAGVDGGERVPGEQRLLVGHPGGEAAEDEVGVGDASGLGLDAGHAAEGQPVAEDAQVAAPVVGAAPAGGAPAAGDLEAGDDAVAGLDAVDVVADLAHGADELVPGHGAGLDAAGVAVVDVQVGPAEAEDARVDDRVGGLGELGFGHVLDGDLAGAPVDDGPHRRVAICWALAIITREARGASGRSGCPARG
jgi:hypothetical protein